MSSADLSRAPSVAGDEIPEALLRHLTGLALADPDMAADAFAADALYAVPGAGDETQSRIETVGRDAIREFRAATPSTSPVESKVTPEFRAGTSNTELREVQLCVVEGSGCLVEGIVRASAGGAALRTFVAAIIVDGSGQIMRYLEYSCQGARDPIPPASGTSRAADALALVHRYFAALDDGQFEDAADCFSERMLYSHPPYRHTGIDSGDRVEFRTRRDLKAAFTKRGRQAFGHEILTCVQRGPHAMLEGIVFGLPADGTGSFISSLSLDADNRIERYVSFYCEPAVPQR